MAKKKSKQKPKRNYKKEYENYHSKPEQRERNNQRKKARRIMVKCGKCKPGDGKDVHHKDHDTSNNDKSNLSVVSQKYNRKKNRPPKKGKK